MSERCSELSRRAGEPLSATATQAGWWLLLEVPGTWPRDVAEPGALPEPAHAAVSAWLAGTPRSRLLFLRRPGRARRPSLAFVVQAEETAVETRRIEIARLDDLVDVDLASDGDVVDVPLVLVCGHGSRDACCALRGTAVFGVLARTLGEEELWISSHHGGHRFAANVLVLPFGVHLGRIGPEEAPTVVGRALAGRIELDRYRGRTCHEPAVQAAEHAVREACGLTGMDDLRLAAREGSVVRFHGPAGSTYAATVVEREGPLVPASCGAPPEPQRVLEAALLTSAGS